MTVTLLTGPDQKEGASPAYVKALAARAKGVTRLIADVVFVGG